jgi:hypothetical protein
MFWSNTSSNCFTVLASTMSLVRLTHDDFFDVVPCDLPGCSALLISTSVDFIGFERCRRRRCCCSCCFSSIGDIDKLLLTRRNIVGGTSIDCLLSEYNWLMFTRLATGEVTRTGQALTKTERTRRRVPIEVPTKLSSTSCSSPCCCSTTDVGLCSNAWKTVDHSSHDFVLPMLSMTSAYDWINARIESSERDKSMSKQVDDVLFMAAFEST